MSIQASSWDLEGQQKERGEKEKWIEVHADDVIFLVVRDHRDSELLVDRDIIK